MNQLCGAYWRPLYAFFRRQVRDVDRAQDLTQEFFLSLLQRDFVNNVDEQSGRLRAFLIAAARHFLSNQRVRQRAVKRGGQVQHLSIDWQAAEQRFQAKDPQLSPERLFDREWAVAVLDRVLLQLQQDYAGKGKQRLFEVLSASLGTQSDAVNYESVARQLEISRDAARVAMHRIRRKYREVLRREIAETMLDSDHVDDELNQLLQILTASPAG